MSSVVVNREERWAFHMMFKELAIEDTPGFSKYMIMSHAKCVAFVEKIAPFVVKQGTCIKSALIKPAISIRVWLLFQEVWPLLFRIFSWRIILKMILMRAASSHEGRCRFNIFLGHVAATFFMCVQML